MRSINRVLMLIMAALMLLTFGCESFSRKFTRKKPAERAVEMVLSPEEYSSPEHDPVELYRQNLLYWGSWYDEFLAELSPSGNRKRRIYCLDESLKHLRICIDIAGASKGEETEKYMGRVLKLRGRIESDVYGKRTGSLRNPAEVLKRELSAYLNRISPAARGEKHAD